MDSRDDGGFDVVENEFQESSVADRVVAEEVSEAQMEAERILRDYAQPEGFRGGFVDAEEAVALLEMEVEQAREINNVSGELDAVVDELEHAYELVSTVYDECDERNILARGAV